MVDITDWNDLDAAIQGTNGSEDTGDYVLQNDLDSDTAGYSGIGDSWQPCGVNATGSNNTGFGGTFDGNGYEIRDLVIDDNSHNTSEDSIGLFGTTAGSPTTVVIENLGVRGTIDTTNNSGFRAGLLVGFWSNATEIRDCYVEGAVNAPNMTSVGGLVGDSSSPTIDNTYAIVDVTGGSQVGGLIGNNSDSVGSSYSSGAVSGDSEVGGFTGQDFGTITDCYWDTEASGQSTSAGSATGLTTAEMQGSSAETNLSGFDFSGTWETVESTDLFTAFDGYPVLQSILRGGQLRAQNVHDTETLTGTITQSGSGVGGALVYAYTVPGYARTTPTTTASDGTYSLEIPADDTPPFEVAVGVDFDDGTDRFGRAKTVLFDP